MSGKDRENVEAHTRIQAIPLACYTRRHSSLLGLRQYACFPFLPICEDTFNIRNLTRKGSSVMRKRSAGAVLFGLALIIASEATSTGDRGPSAEKKSWPAQVLPAQPMRTSLIPLRNLRRVRRNDWPPSIAAVCARRTCPRDRFLRWHLPSSSDRWGSVWRRRRPSRQS